MSSEENNGRIKALVSYNSQKQYNVYIHYVNVRVYMYLHIANKVTFYRNLMFCYLIKIFLNNII